MDKSGDIGYWVGYRIVKSYYQHATDKQAAIREIIEMKDPKAFLAKSGYTLALSYDFLARGSRTSNSGYGEFF
jgi:hypothetical protein